MASKADADVTETKGSDKLNDNLRECETLHKLLSQIPKKAQSGILKTYDLILTCIDANEAYIAIGTNVGLVFLFCREDNSIQRLKTNNMEDIITQTRLHHGIELQVAVGTTTGKVYLFHVTGKLAEAKRNQIQKFDVIDVHSDYITCLEWSTNGMKLFSGDIKGHIVITEVDFDKNECKSCLLLVESGTEIIQLDYDHKSLLVSTKEKSFIIQTGLKLQISTVGTQNHRMSGTFGACFIPGLCKRDDALLYTARAGCRIWLSDVKGSVINTLIFSSPLSAAVQEIPLLQTGKLQLDTQEFQFGKLKFFRDCELVTWSSTAIVVVDPTQNKVVAQQSRLSGITDVAVVKSGEIFILRKHAEAKIIRISCKPEKEPKRVEIELPIVTGQKTMEKKQEKENTAKSFFKKAFATQLKKLDDFVHDTSERILNPHEEFPEASPAPTLPPALPSIETDYKPALPSVQTDYKSALPSVETDYKPALPSVETDYKPVLPSVEIDGKLLVTAPEVDTISQHRNAEADRAKEVESGQNQDAVDGCINQVNSGSDIVFSHKAKRKHRHRNKKEIIDQSLHVDKDEDSVSIHSNMSITSADFPQAPQNTPASFDSTYDALQKADDMLHLIENILHKDHAEQFAQDKPEPVVAQDDKVETFQPHLTLAELGQDPHDSTEKLNVSELDFENLDCVDKYPIQSQIETRLEEKDTIANADDIVEQALSKYVQNQEEICLKKGNKEKSVDINPSEDVLEEPCGSSKLEAETKTDNLKAPECSDFNSDIYKDLHSIESSDPFKKGLMKDLSTDDDFYSKYCDSYPGVFGDSISEPRPPTLKVEADSAPSNNDTQPGITFPDITPAVLANAWSEVTTPTNISSVSMSNSHIWFTDKRDNIYYSCLGGAQGIQWRKVSGLGSQIAVSLSGQIVWRLHKNTVFVGTKISTNHPEGMKWVEALREVAFIAVDNNCAWFLKCNGEVMMQRGLSLERPFFKSKTVECSHQLKKIYCRQGVVWAITKDLKLLVRTGVTADFPEGSEWTLYTSERLPHSFCDFAIDVTEKEKIGWAVDEVGQIWFCDDLTDGLLQSKSCWWQVPLSKYVLQEESTFEMIKSSVQKLNPLQLGLISAVSNTVLIACSSQGLCMTLNSKNNLHLCRGNIVGYHWLPGQPSQLSPHSTWKIVSANTIHLSCGRVWAQHTNCEFYVFKESNSDAKLLEEMINFTCVSSSSTSVWALEPDGSIKIRAGVSSFCPEGTEWVSLNLSQLGDVHIVHLSCNSSFVWAVESRGLIYQRIGVKPPSENGLNPVWLSVDSFSDIVFTQVHMGSLDWMVWAIDNRRFIYVRAGVTETMPIGSEWIHCSGIPAVDLALTNSGVWALSPAGEIYFRHGITRESICGNYWKKIPGTFIKISASPYDDLWAIDTKGQLVCCNSRYILRQQNSPEPLLPRQSSISSSVSEENDWELL